MPLAFVFLAIAILSVWLPPVRRNVLLWPLPGLAALAAGLQSGVLEPAALLPLGGLSGLALYATRMERGRARLACYTLAALLALGLALHLFPGFAATKLVSAQQLAADSMPFSLLLRFDKPAAGLILLACFGAVRPYPRDIGRRLALGAGTGLVTAAAVMGFALFAGLVRPDPKLPDFAWIFLATNLLFTCVAEEMFFRGMIQSGLAKCLSPSLKTWLPVLVSSLLFALAHAQGGSQYMLLVWIAGVGYAGAYALTGRIEAAILAHFIVNAIHFLGFSYPMLAVPR